MAGEEVRLAQARLVLGRDADRLHEIHGLADAIGKLAVALALRAVLDEAEHPLVHVLEVGIATHREGAQKVQRRGRLAVSHHLAFRVRNAGFLGELDAVDDVTTVARQRHAVERLDARRARLGELAGNATDLDDRKLGAIGQHDGHLQEGAEEVADIVGAVLGKALGAVAALQEESVAFSYIGKVLLETARFTGKNEWRIRCQLGFSCRNCCLIRIIRDLLDRFLPPTVRSPILCHLAHLSLYPVPAGYPVFEIWGGL
jgi:hypothetical protein